MFHGRNRRRFQGQSDRPGIPIQARKCDACTTRDGAFSWKNHLAIRPKKSIFPKNGVDASLTAWISPPVIFLLQMIFRLFERATACHEAGGTLTLALAV
jgi:hypothetical protein